MKILGVTYCECCGEPIGEFYGTKEIKIVAFDENLNQVSGGTICNNCHKKIFPSGVIVDLLYLKREREKKEEEE